MAMSTAKNEETLLTKKSLQLSLSPPRCAPLDTIQRSVMTISNNRGSKSHIGDHHLYGAHSSYNHHSGLRERLMHLVYNADLHDIPHPHLAVDSPHNTTRFLGSILPLEWQNGLRDGGGFRRICDELVQNGIPLAAISNPSAARTFLALTNRVQKMRYGDHPSQFIDLLFPEDVAEDDLTGMLVFIHGGAWGSGKTWFYTLTAIPFLKRKVAVAIVGYRVYPDGDVNIQARDTELAYQKLSAEYPRLCGPARTPRPIGLILMGHSSGAHIGLLFLIEQLKRAIQVREHADVRTTTKHLNDNNPISVVDQFVGLSGPYDISHHFDYEAARGVEEISPLKPACGYTREQFRLNSPALRLKDFLPLIPTGRQDLLPQTYFPRTLLVHGIEDDVVPFTSTSEAAQVLRSCGITSIEEHYAPKTGHQDVIVAFMLGGKVPKAVMEWLENGASPQSSIMRSKL